MKLLTPKSSKQVRRNILVKKIRAAKQRRKREVLFREDICKKIQRILKLVGKRKGFTRTRDDLPGREMSSIRGS